MKAIGKIIVFVLLAGAIMLVPRPARSGNDVNMDVVLVIDSSGSMAKTDPLSLRIPAAKLFISLLEEGDRMGIVSFSDRGSVLSDLTPVDSQENRDKLFSAAERITADGLYTNLYEAFNSGYGVLSLHDKGGSEKIIILLSDGIMDVGNPDQDRRLAGNLTNSLTETLSSENIRVYAIAFTEQSDRKLLRKISKRTGGFFNTALTDRDLHGVFTSIFESLKSPEMVPVNENGFVIDSSIEELTIVATKGDPDTEIQILSPDGESYSSGRKYSGIDWFVSENFDMITIVKPLEGKWEVLFSTGENNRAYVITNLTLQTDFNQMYAIFGEQMDVRVWLEKDGDIITEDDVLDRIDVSLELTGPGGNTTKLRAFHKGGGIFSRKITPFTPGNHSMNLVAEGMTFQRAKGFSFNVADLEESKKDLQDRREEKKRQENAHAGQGPDREKDEDEISFMKLFAQFIVMNVILGMIALGYFKREIIREYIKLGNMQDLAQRLKGLTKRRKRKQEGEEERTGGELPADEPVESAEESPAAGPAPQAPSETGKQPESDPAEEESSEAPPQELESEEVQPMKTQSVEETEDAGYAGTSPDPETEETRPAESRPESGQSGGEQEEEHQKSRVDLEEIEMEEKGKYREALQDEEEQVTDSLPDAEEDNPFDTDSPEAEAPVEDAEQTADATHDDDDIEMTPKDSPDDHDDTSQNTASEETAEQTADAARDDDDIEMTPKGSPDDHDDTSQNTASEETAEQTADAARDDDDIEMTPKDSPDDHDDQPQETAGEGDAERKPAPAAEADVFDSVMAEMEEAMDQERKQGGEVDIPSPDSTPTDDIEQSDGGAGGD